MNTGTRGRLQMQSAHDDIYIYNYQENQENVYKECREIGYQSSCYVINPLVKEIQVVPERHGLYMNNIYVYISLE